MILRSDAILIASLPPLALPGVETDLFLDRTMSVQMLRIGDFIENQIKNIKMKKRWRSTNHFSDVKSCDLHANTCTFSQYLGVEICYRNTREFEFVQKIKPKSHRIWTEVSRSAISKQLIEAVW